MEFEEQKTIEAKLSKLIDALDADIHELDYKKDWDGWTEKFYLDKRKHLLEDFPELEDIFNMLLDYLKKEKYLED